ncbi:MAG: NTP transferase domain-containing protein [Candidatus Poseidoniaceae archaeon]|nr:NTP transferase domain-containing protein [Candidatus Poseidoniaceae archaeon]
MTTVLLLAGGESSRMGTDKAQMHGGVQRLQNVAKSCGIKEIIVLCGGQERRSMFQGKVWPDPPFCNNLTEVIQWAFKEIDGPIQLICCDAFQLEVDGLQQLLLSKGAVPLDEQKIRQPLLANCPEDFELGESDGSVASLFSHLPSLDMGSKANQMKNFNLPSDDSFQ